MDSRGFFYQAFVYLLAAALAVPIARRLGLGSVLGYLLAGVAIGPSALGFIPAGGDVMHFAEFGVVMLLFLVGLELRPALLWELRTSILGLGAAQVIGTALLVTLIALFSGVSWNGAVAVGFILAMSSTAIVLQSLTEKGLANTPGGQACFSVLLFQDIFVIPILAILPLLAKKEMASPVGDTAAMAGLPGWQQAIVTMGAVAMIILIGRVALRHFFRFIAAARLREMFTATALLLVVGVVLLMNLVGVSPALGAFIAGVVLAESEYRHQLEADIEPFKGLLLGLFFLSVGATLDLKLIARGPLLITLLATGLIALKFTVLFALGRGFRMAPGDRSLFAFSLAQVGEFAFVLFSVAEQQRVLDRSITGPLVAAAALSMGATPLLLLIHEKLVMPQLVGGPARDPDKITPQHADVVLAGFGRFGHIVGLLLRANGFEVIVLDNDADQVDTLRKFGLNSFYGDASREDLLRTAGIEQARLFILAIDNERKSLEIVKMLKKAHPHLQILARAASRQHAYELLRLGISHVHRETLGSAVDLAVDALRVLGMERDHAERVARLFKEHDEASVREMASIVGDEGAYASRARQHIENLERLLRSDRATIGVAPHQSAQAGTRG